MKRLARIPTLVAVLLTAVPGPPRGVAAETEAEREAVSRLDVRVDTVLSGGRWCRGTEQGTYRVVVYSGGFEEVYHHLFVQWLRVDDRKREIVLQRTLPVREAQGLDLVFSNLTLAPAGTGPCGDAVVEGAVSRRTADRGQQPERFRMRITPEGTYEATFTAGARLPGRP